jgi:alkanesulfonate monooxygenase SsuD/methylene tetrahydromethanopterin reductase-like flavin-dependent oxidoreductase (luciferase family)
LNSPPALSSPHPRVLIGGTGEKKTLRLVARYADACNIFELGPAGVAGKLQVLQDHCANEGRDYGQIERTTLGILSLSMDGANGTQTVDQAVERFAQYAEIGIDHAIVSLPRVSDPRSFELVPELVRRLAEVPTAGR